VATVHTIFTLRYARSSHRSCRRIDFQRQAAPSYVDFAYVASLSDDLSGLRHRSDSHEIRRTALRHALLSYLFGAVIIGMMIINIVASLLKELKNLVPRGVAVHRGRASTGAGHVPRQTGLACSSGAAGEATLMACPDCMHVWGPGGGLKRRSDVPAS